MTRVELLQLACVGLRSQALWVLGFSDRAQVREDVTRYRYGDEQHLDEALDRIFRFNKARHCT